MMKVCVSQNGLKMLTAYKNELTSQQKQKDSPKIKNKPIISPFPLLKRMPSMSDMLSNSKRRPSFGNYHLQTNKRQGGTMASSMNKKEKKKKNFYDLFKEQKGLLKTNNRYIRKRVDLLNKSVDYKKQVINASKRLSRLQDLSRTTRITPQICLKTEYDSYFLKKAKRKQVNPGTFYPEFLSLQRCLKTQEKYKNLKKKIGKSKINLKKILTTRKNTEHGRPAVLIMKEAMSSHNTFRKTIQNLTSRSPRLKLPDTSLSSWEMQKTIFAGLGRKKMGVNLSNGDWKP